MSRLPTPHDVFKLGFPWRRPRLSFRNELENLLSNVFGDEDEGWPDGSLKPSVDLCETDDMLEARLDLPGVLPAEINIQINGDTLTVSGERNEERHTAQDRKFHRVERRTGTFCRSIRLPCAVSETEVTAQQKHGVLTITMPKVQPNRPFKIEIS